MKIGAPPPRLGLMVLSILLQRCAFIVRLRTSSVISLFFPLALALLGLAVMNAGIQYHRHQDRVETAIRSRIPQSIGQVLPDARAGV